MSARRKTLSLQKEEWAIIRTRDIHEDTLTESKHYVMTLDMCSTSLLVYSSTLVPVGEILHIDVSLQGRAEPCRLKGVARTAIRSDDSRGYLVSVDLLADDNTVNWRRQFH